MQSIKAEVEYNPLSCSYGDMKSEAVAQFERKFVELTLTEFKGNLSAASRALKMDRKYLYELTKKYGLR